LGQQGQLALVVTISYLVIFVLVCFCGIRWAKLTPGGSAVLALTLAFPNLAAVGFPLLESMHGPASNVAVAVGLAIGAITVSPITLAILENGAGQKTGTTSKYLVVQSFIKAFRKSVVWAPLLGIVFACFSISLPKPLDLSLRTLGSATTGSALFLTGLVVSAQPFKLDRAVLLSVLAKNIIQPAFCLLLAIGIGMPPQQRDFVVLISAIPGGFFGVVFGKSFPNAVPEVASASLICTYLAGVLTMAGWMVLLRHMA
jgi:malonate transporter and related proteins